MATYRAIRWNQLSLRNKLTLVNVALLTLGIVVAGIGTTLMLRPTLVGQLDAQLTAIAADPYTVVGGDPTTHRFSYDNVRQAPQPYYVALVDNSGQLLIDNWGQRPRAIAPSLAVVSASFSPSTNMLPADAAGYPVFEISDGLGSTWRAIAVPEQDYVGDQVRGTLVVALPMSTVNSTMASFLAIFFGFGLTVVIFGAALTRLLVSATLQPLRNVEATAMSFAAGDYAQRLPESTPNTEVGRLSRSLNTMLGRIDQALDERQETIARMRRFVGDASHELRTPLVTVRGYAELYRMGALDDPDKVAQAMDRVEREAMRMTGLVEDLLQLARLDETRELVKDIIDLEPIAEDAAMDARAQSPGRVVTALPMRVILEPDAGASEAADPTDDPVEPDDAPAESDDTAAAEAPDAPGREVVDVALAGTVAVGAGSSAVARADGDDAKPRRRWLRTPAIPRLTRAQLAGLLRRKTSEPVVVDPATGEIRTLAGQDDAHDVPAMVHANENKVRQAVSNVIGNALRYTPDDSPLEVGVVLDVPDRIAAVEIIDHGEGVPPEIRDKIFQRFWRADTSRARATGGSGLGLAIVTAIMRAHDGSVAVFETPGGGATFRLRFPLLVAGDVDGDPSTAATESSETTTADA